ncbi:MAG TPA: hypothetical protein VF665_13595 [Longimicrobium sp.]|jgi:hypothetical protein|uniref:hypothetical protein n=1 Tax=Longimicrobium sp. TaxID=2029185 RepID=UPI002ED9D818
MAYSRYLDLFIANDFHTTAFTRDREPQERHQAARVGEYRWDVIDPISVRRGVEIRTLADNILWVCQADGDGGKLRLNAHGDSNGIYNDSGYGIAADALAKFLKAHGLVAENMGSPGLVTVNLAVCNAATGARAEWLIKKLADALALPGVRFTGAAAITRMSREGRLRVEYPRYVAPHLRSGKYVPPALQPKALAMFAGSHLKREYTYQP